MACAGNGEEAEYGVKSALFRYVIPADPVGAHNLEEPAVYIFRHFYPQGGVFGEMVLQSTIANLCAGVLCKCCLSY